MEMQVLLQKNGFCKFKKTEYTFSEIENNFLNFHSITILI